jgi:serine/threonine protein kinase
MIGKFISRYRIVEKLGEGGMGKVYLAEDSELNRKVALKFLPPQFTEDAEVNARFKHEARAAASLNHPNIITVYDVGEHEGNAFIAMEYIRGQSLRNLLAKEELSTNKILDIATQICLGLSEAHQAGIIHRDIKPDNILIDAKGLVKISDFGLAKSLGRTMLTQEGSTLGTLQYMSPEQLSGENVDHRSDIWSFGVVLYEMISGQLPFKEEYNAAITYAIVHQEPEPLARYKTGVSEGLQHIIDKALDKDPETRYQNITDLLADLKREKKTGSTSIKTTRTVKKKKSPQRAMTYVSILIAVIFIVLFAIDKLQKKPANPIPATYTQLTFTGKAYLPTISPDGQYIAYFHDGGKGDAKIMVQEIKGGQPLEVFSGIASPHAYTLLWSPDGSELLLEATVVGSAFSNLYIIPRLGGSARRVLGTAWSCWSPDGSLIAGHGQNQRRILFTNTSSGDTSSIALDVDSLEVGWLDWSVENKRLLFCTLPSTTGETAIWTINPDGSQQQKVVMDSVWFRSPRWSATGKAIYYLRPKNETSDLMKIAVDPATGKGIGRPKVLQAGLQAGWRISVSRDNKRFLYTRELEYSNLWLIDIDSSQSTNMQMEQLTTGTSYIYSPEISPDGKAIAFISTKLGKSQLFIMPIKGGPMRQLTFLNGDVNGVAWSPDGKEIAFGYFEGPEGKVLKVDTTGSTPLAFANSQLGIEGFISWYPGSDIIYGQPNSKNFQILNPITQEERQLMQSEHGSILTRTSVSYDGKQAAVILEKDNHSSLWLISLTDYSQTLLSSSSSNDPITWSRDGKWIYGVDPYAERPFPISKISVAGSGNHKLLELSFDGIDFDQVSMTPDGKRIVCAASEKQSDVWMMENFDPDVK